jgi:hypothetical protein
LVADDGRDAEIVPIDGGSALTIVEDLVPGGPTVGMAVASALELEQSQFEIVLVDRATQEVVHTGVDVSLRDLEVLGSAAHHYSEVYDNPERRRPQVLARRERARRIGRPLWHFAVARCGLEAADRAGQPDHAVPSPWSTYARISS